MWARLGVHKAAGDPYACYYEEVFEHGGFWFRPLETLTAEDLRQIDVLVLAGYGKLDGETRGLVQSWVESGGSVVCSGSPWGLESLLGLIAPSRHFSFEYLKSSQPDRLWPEFADRVKFIGGDLCPPGKCRSVACTPEGFVGVSRIQAGRGLALFVGPHIGQTMARMQLGVSVETDGIGPNDGSAILDDGMLRAEDGSVLSFEADRDTAGDSPPFFKFPYADTLKEILLRAVMNALEHTGKCAMLLWQWPNLAPAAATLTLECDDLEPEHVYPMYQLLSLHGCPAAWMVPAPGYPLDTYRMLIRWEHEIGSLFIAENKSGWTEDHLKLQRIALSRSAATQSLVTVRPIFGYWRGWDAFYDMCEVGGARVSVSKGGRQPGTAGFLFGTCQPFFSYKTDTSSRLVLEVPYQIYMPGEVVSDAVCDALFSQAVLHSGCLHFVAAPKSIANPTAANSIRRIIINGRSNHLAFLKPEQILDYEKARRSMRRVYHHVDREGQAVLIPDATVEGLSILLSGPVANVEIRGKLVQLKTFEKYGTKFLAFQTNLEQKQHLEVRVRAQSCAMAV